MAPGMLVMARIAAILLSSGTQAGEQQLEGAGEADGRSIPFDGVDRPGFRQ
jgi:hypothetical protein